MDDIFKGDELIDGLTPEDLQQAAQRYLDTENYIKVVLLPEGFEVTAVLEEHSSVRPQSFSLEQNYPNSFNSGTAIRFALPAGDAVELAVYNAAGQKVATLVQGERQASVYTVLWDDRDEDGQELASSIYVYRLETDVHLETRKLLLLR